MPRLLASSMESLNAEIQDWADEIKLDIHNFSNLNRYSEAACFVKVKLSTGSLLAIHQVKHREYQVKMASKCCKSFLLHFPGILNACSDNIIATLELKLYQQLLYNIQNTLEAEYIILTNSLRAWLQSSSSQLSSILDEVHDFLFSTSYISTENMIKVYRQHSRGLESW